MVNYAKLGIVEDFRQRKWNDLFELDDLDEDDKFLYKTMFDASKKWADAVINKKTSMGLYLYGSNGSGKSTLGCLLLKKFLKNEIQAMRVTSVRLQKDFFANWTVPAYALMKGVLFIDEVGKEYQTKQEHSEMVLEYILKYRTERHLHTILASNADGDFLKKRYGATVNSILKGKFIPIGFPDIDLRQLLAEGEARKIIGG